MSDEAKQIDPAEHLGLVGMVVRHVLRYHPHFEYDDLFQEGAIALCRAAKFYDGRAKFSTYGITCIRRQLFRIVRRDTPRSRRARPLADLYDAPDERDVMALRETTQSLLRLRVAMADLPAIDRRLIRDRMEGRTLRELAAERGVSTEAIRQRANRIIGRLRSRITENDER